MKLPLRSQPHLNTEAPGSAQVNQMGCGVQVSSQPEICKLLISESNINCMEATGILGVDSFASSVLACGHVGHMGLALSSGQGHGSGH